MGAPKSRAYPGAAPSSAVETEFVTVARLRRLAAWGLAWVLVGGLVVRAVCLDYMPLGVVRWLIAFLEP